MTIVNSKSKVGRSTLIVLFLLALPLAAYAQTYQYSRQGIFDCNIYGGAPQNIGSQTAQGSIYVPVADYTVEQNTGILVYKECILREIIDRQREAAMTAFLKKMYRGVQEGRNGSPLYVQNQGKELLVNVSDPTFLQVLQDGTFDNLNPSIRDTVIRAVAPNY